MESLKVTSLGSGSCRTGSGFLFLLHLHYAQMRFAGMVTGDIDTLGRAPKAHCSSRNFTSESKAELPDSSHQGAGLLSDSY